MDDTDDRAYARAPELEDVINLCRALNTAGVQYVLIGGFAVIFHGFVRGTKDIDLLVDAAPDNVARIKRALATFPDNAAALMADDEVAQYQVVRIADEIVVDLMAKACGIDYLAAQAGIEWITVEGVRIPLASKALLIQTKATWRPSDHVDVEYLKARIAEDDNTPT